MPEGEVKRKAAQRIVLTMKDNVPEVSVHGYWLKSELRRCGILGVKNPLRLAVRDEQRRVAASMTAEEINEMMAAKGFKEIADARTV